MLWVYRTERLSKNLSKIIEENKINFSVINGENAADDRRSTKNS